MISCFPAHRFLQLGRILFLISAISLIPSISGAEPRLEESLKLVDTLVADIMAVVESDPSPEKVRLETDRMIDTYFDYNIIARFAAGNAWRSAGDAEKTVYMNAFREILLSLAETQFNYFKTLEYKPGKATPKGDKLVVVQGQIHDTSGELPDTAVSWRIRTWADKPPRIIDIEIENISMLITQQQENTAVINSNGGSFQALIDSLTAQASEIRASNGLTSQN